MGLLNWGNQTLFMDPSQALLNFLTLSTQLVLTLQKLSKYLHMDLIRTSTLVQRLNSGWVNMELLIHLPILQWERVLESVSLSMDSVYTDLYIQRVVILGTRLSEFRKNIQTSLWQRLCRCVFLSWWLSGGIYTINSKGLCSNVSIAKRLNC